MKTRFLIIGIVLAVLGSLMLVSLLLHDNLNFLEMSLPHNKYGLINYEKIGYQTSFDDFASKLNEKDISYSLDDLVFIQGISRASYPPTTDYCGYVMAKDGNDYWYWSSVHKDTLSRNEITEENPMPCRPNMGSCICSLETKIAEKNINTLSYFDSEEQKFVEGIVQKYLSSINMAGGPEKFVIGKYNHKFESDDIAFCGAFVSEMMTNPEPDKVLRENVTKVRYMQGTIRDPSHVLGFSISVNSEKLCAINQDANVITFERVNRLENSGSRGSSQSCGFISTVPKEWTEMQINPSFEDWEKTGAFAINKKFNEVIHSRDIVIEETCMDIRTGGVEESNPPNIAMCTIVTALNGTQLTLEGTVNQFDVYYFHIDNKIPYQCDEKYSGCLCNFEELQ
ncbi:hypothetical protein [Nitrosopumilus sp.]|uniref:hypothetical protein n=1 Tax=Nitrosopumilus sp. TaxID=2024843 RepID=UPI00349FD669